MNLPIKLKIFNKDEEDSERSNKPEKKELSDTQKKQLKQMYFMIGFGIILVVMIIAYFSYSTYKKKNSGAYILNENFSKIKGKYNISFNIETEDNTYNITGEATEDANTTHVYVSYNEPILDYREIYIEPIDIKLGIYYKDITEESGADLIEEDITVQDVREWTVRRQTELSVIDDPSTLFVEKDTSITDGKLKVASFNTISKNQEKPMDENGNIYYTGTLTYANAMKIFGDSYQVLLEYKSFKDTGTLLSKIATTMLVQMDITVNDKKIINATITSIPDELKNIQKKYKEFSKINNITYSIDYIDDTIVDIHVPVEITSKAKLIN